MARSILENENYLPGKVYPEEGLITGAIATPADKGLINLFLRGEKSRFGEWRVVEWLGRVQRPTRGPRQFQGNWRIQCSCGYEREIAHDNLNMMRNNILKRGQRERCGNPVHEDEWSIGRSYDRLTIVGHAVMPFGKYHSTWHLLCECSCGKYTKETPYAIPPSYIRDPLAKGATMFGCGCRNASQDRRSNTSAALRWYQAKRRAAEFELDFDIDIDDCEAPELCPVIGIPLYSNPNGPPTDNSPTVDRIIPSMGYVKGNVAVISNRANRIKNDGTYEDIRLVADWLKRQVSTIKNL